jgi:hypothetical protein
MRTEKRKTPPLSFEIALGFICKMASQNHQEARSVWMTWTERYEFSVAQRRQIESVLR